MAAQALDNVPPPKSRGLLGLCKVCKPGEAEEFAVKNSQVHAFSSSLFLSSLKLSNPKKYEPSIRAFFACHRRTLLRTALSLAWSSRMSLRGWLLKRCAYSDCMRSLALSFRGLRFRAVSFRRSGIPREMLGACTERELQPSNSKTQTSRLQPQTPNHPPSRSSGWTGSRCRRSRRGTLTPKP